MTNQEKQHTTNRLVNETSTYLLQHAHNPVDWYAWGEEALTRSKKEDKPIFLSIGYAACHWCHVMEHESFEDKDTASLMNTNFINIKVDREERTDLDEIYMKAVQMMTGHGGWPMTVFLTPELKPFFGGTYFPPEDRHGLPGFKKLLLGVTEAWKNQREEIEKSSDAITEQLSSIDRLPSERDQSSSIDSEITSAIDSAVGRYLVSFDQKWGGFGGAPKFPHSFSLALTMRYVAHIQKSKSSKYEECLQLITTTLDRMAYGGMQDQLGGGFARYSVDRQWLVPHFEKMLYDNALLCQTYFDGYLLTGRSYWRDVACNILEFVLRELKTENGAFYSSLDADSEGEEGRFYVFKSDEIIASLGADGHWFNDVFGISATGNFEHGTSVLHLTDSPENLASKYKLSIDEFWQKLETFKKRVLKERDKRVRPQRDEKVLVGWNSLMISAFVDGYRVTGESKYLDAAKDATRFILNELITKEGRLLRTWGKGKAKLNAYLDDYSYFVQALLDMASVDGELIWYQNARRLTDHMLRHFWDSEQDNFFYTSDDHETLLARPKNHFDGSVPSATSVAIFDMLRLAFLSGNTEYRNKAEKLIQLYLPYAKKIPEQFANLLCACDFYLANPVEIALLADTAGGAKFIQAIGRIYLPNKIMLVSSESGGEKFESPLLEGRALIDSKSTVYICRNYACDAPITDLDVLEQKVSTLSQS
jgi:uncharacterized protein YyaL (SSP411 family)